MATSYQALRKTAAEILANVVVDILPDTQLFGPYVSNNTFGYDFVLPAPVDDHVIGLIEHKMGNLAKSNVPITSVEMVRHNAAAMFKHYDQDVLADQVADFVEEIISVVKIGDFHDAANGPFTPTTNSVRFFKILGVTQYSVDLPSGYQEKITRIEGVVHEDQKELKKIVKQWKEGAKKASQERKVLELFLPMPSGAAVFAMPKGETVLQLLRNWAQLRYQELGFQVISSPSARLCGSEDLFGSPFGMAHAALYSLLPAKVKEGMVAFAEFGQGESPQPYGPLKGLFTLDEYHCDQGHLFCSKEQLKSHMISSLHFIVKTATMLLSDFHWVLYTKIDKIPGTGKQWETGLSLLKEALDIADISYEIDETMVFKTGPRVELRWLDASGKSWQGPYLGIDILHGTETRVKGAEKTTASMLECSLLGPWERLIALLLEQGEGKLPSWLEPKN